VTTVAADEVAAIVYHAPPVTRYKDTAAAVAEGSDAVSNVVRAAAGGAVMVAADWNSRSVQGRVAAGAQGTVAGDKIDALVASGLDVVSWSYRTTVNGVRLGSDHRHALRVVVRRRGNLLTKLVTRKRVVWFYNVRVGRRSSVVARELRAMLADRRTLALFVVEATGYNLPRLASHQLVRDRTTEGRANVAAYVRRGHLRFKEWVDLEQTWRMTEHVGRHPARSLLVLVIGWKR
jgi:hypothetical protein